MSRSDDLNILKIGRKSVENWNMMSGSHKIWQDLQSEIILTEGSDHDPNKIRAT